MAIWADLLDLVLPRNCAGCMAAGSGWCAECAAEFAGPPQQRRPESDPGVQCWSLGRYDGIRRAAVLAVKVRGRRDLITPLGTALADGVRALRQVGELSDSPLLLVPAPTRRACARERGGDPVAAITEIAASRIEHCRAVRLLWTAGAAQDSVGLSARQRRQNLSGRIRLHRRRLPVSASQVLLIDDVLTTGATAAESVRLLRTAGLTVIGALTLTAA